MTSNDDLMAFLMAEKDARSREKEEEKLAKEEEKLARTKERQEAWSKLRI